MTDVRDSVARTLEELPVVGVVRTDSFARAEAMARQWIDAGLGMIEVTFTVPRATTLVESLLADRPADAIYRIGMGTATTPDRTRSAIAAGAEFIISPNVDTEVARLARDAGRYVLLGALTPTEIVAAWNAGADKVKVYPLPPVGGSRYLETIRGPLGDIPMLAAGGFGVDEIPAYRRAGASAFGLGDPLLGDSGAATAARVASALSLARGSREETRR